MACIALKNKIKKKQIVSMTIFDFIIVIVRIDVHFGRN